MTYHVGLLQHGRKAIFQYRRSVDFLDCEILEYYGERASTKKAARERLRECRQSVLDGLNARYPGRNFRCVVVD